MPRGYRRFLFTLGGGIALLAIGAGAERAAIWADGPSTYPKYKETAEEAQKRLPALTIAQAAEALEQQQPCRSNQGHDASDLCAQWRAADAAQRASRWAWWQMFFSLAGVIGLIVTLWFNFRALGIAEDAAAETVDALDIARRSADSAANLVRISDRNARLELRAYLDFDGVRGDVNPAYDDPKNPDGKGVLLKVTIKNYGRTPAENVETSVISKTRFSQNTDAFPFTEEDRKDINAIAPSDHFDLKYHWRFPSALLAQIEQENVIVVISVFVTYTDIFGKPHVLRGDFEGRGLKDNFGVVEGTRAST